MASPVVSASSTPLSIAAAVSVAPASSHPTASAANTASTLVFSPPDFIILGDSMVRSVLIPRGITYPFSGAKILDLLEHAPAIIERHPSAHTVIVHGGVNDLRCRQSSKLRADYEILAESIESLGKLCVFSGLIPSLRRSSEMFSTLCSADQWLKNF